jgi:hypothetical protein
MLNPEIMKNILLSLLVLTLFGACSSVTVSSDYDRDANFASYKSFAFAPEANQLQVGDINRKRIIDAVTSELALKGITPSDQPDVLIDLKITAQQKETATATNTGGYGAGYGYRWGGGFSTTTINVEQYVEGTLFVDMIDSSKKQLVWQGRGVGTLDPNASAEKREKNINYAVKQIFMKYPPKK